MPPGLHFLVAATGIFLKKSLATASIELRIAREVFLRSARSWVFGLLQKLLREFKRVRKKIVRLHHSYITCLEFG